MPENPFSRPSTLPYQMPPFDRVRNADYRPGFEEGMRQQREEVRQVAPATGLRVAGLAEAVPGVLAHGFEHPVADARTGGLGEDEAPVDEGGEEIQGV